MIIPKTIKIGETDYKISESLFLFREKSLCGEITYHRKKMKIRLNQTNRGKEDTFFHEVAHGILKELEFNYPKITLLRNDEDFVQELGLLMRKTFLDLMEKQKVKR